MHKLRSIREPWHVPVWMVGHAPGLRAQRLLAKWKRLLRLIRRQYHSTAFFGAKFECDLDDYVQETIALFGVWEPDISSVVVERLKQGDVFLDLGANVGYYSLLASTLVAEQGRVIAVEAAPGTCDILKRNIGRNKRDNIAVVNAAAAGQAGTLELFAGPNGAAELGRYTTMSGSGGSLQAVVQALPIDQLVPDDLAARLSFIKMDVEGAELPLLRHLIDQEARYPALRHILSEYTPGDDRAAWDQLIEDFRAAGYRVLTVRNAYTTDYYLKWRAPKAPEPLERLPEHQCDLLLTRSR